MHVFHHSQVACFGSACDPNACLTVTDLAWSLHSRKLHCGGWTARGSFECVLAAAEDYESCQEEVDDIEYDEDFEEADDEEMLQQS